MEYKIKLWKKIARKAWGVRGANMCCPAPG